MLKMVKSERKYVGLKPQIADKVCMLKMVKTEIEDEGRVGPKPQINDTLFVSISDPQISRYLGHSLMYFILHIQLGREGTLLKLSNTNLIISYSYSKFQNSLRIFKLFLILCQSSEMLFFLLKITIQGFIILYMSFR